MWILTSEISVLTREFLASECMHAGAAARVSPRQAVNPPHLSPPPQHCWLRCWSGAGGPAPTPGAARACAAAPSSPLSVHTRHSRVQHRQPNSQSILLRMTGKMTGKCSTAGDFVQVFPLIREIDPFLTSLLNHRHSQSTPPVPR